MSAAIDAAAILLLFLALLLAGYIALGLWGGFMLRRQERANDSFEAELDDIAKHNVTTMQPGFGARK